MDSFTKIVNNHIELLLTSVSHEYLEIKGENPIDNFIRFVNFLISYCSDNIGDFKFKNSIIKILRNLITLLKDVLVFVISYQLSINNNEIQSILSNYPSYLLTIVKFDYEDSQIKEGLAELVFIFISSSLCRQNCKDINNNT